ncbi:MAG: metallopeptidase family protein [Planctomycetota bacterium]
MNSARRDYFDRILDEVLADLPEPLHRLLDKVTMYVDDYPAPNVLRQLQVPDRRQLCGLYTGIPLGERSVLHSGVLSDAVHVFREGILHRASNAHGKIDTEKLRREIRITVLHELGHHFGMGEAELRELGYG